MRERHPRPAAARYLCVELRGVRLMLDGKAVLRGIDWRIEPGERWALMGANGAGKTQLLKLLAGDVWPTPSARALRRYQLGAQVFDDPYGVKQEIAYVGAERQDRYEHYAWNHRVETIMGTGLYRTDAPLDPLTDADRTRIGRLLARLRLTSLARRRFLSLSYGERRLVLLARALASRPRLLLLDEVFNGLDRSNREHVQYCLAALSKAALPWVLSTHRLEDIPAPVTHLCRLERGRAIVGAHSAGALTRSHERRHTGARRTPRARGDSRSTALPVVFALRNATVWRDGARVLHGLSLDIRRRQCWVVHGPNGSGKSSFVQMLYGDLGVARGGAVVRTGLPSGVPLSAFKAHVGLVAPELQAIHPRHLAVQDVVASGIGGSIGVHVALTPAKRVRVDQALRRVGARGLAARSVRALSYGQLRRVLFARALVHQPDILLLDEPYAGLDAPTRLRLQALVDRLVTARATAVVVTHHRDEWPHAATHELELSGGRIRYCGVVRI